MTAKPDLPIAPFVSRKAWKTWLDEEHAASDRLWLKIAKKGSGIEIVTSRKRSTWPRATAGSTARKAGSMRTTGCSGAPPANRGASGRGLTVRRPRSSSRWA